MTAGTPFIGLGFYIAGEKSPTDNTLTQVDVSAMGGVCITYTSDNDINLRLGIGNEEEAKILAMLKFEIPGEDKTTAEFNIMSVGPYNGDCHQ